MTGATEGLYLRTGGSAFRGTRPTYSSVRHTLEEIDDGGLERILGADDEGGALA